jgi:hypothetical protein
MGLPAADNEQCSAERLSVEQGLSRHAQVERQQGDNDDSEDAVAERLDTRRRRLFLRRWQVSVYGVEGRCLTASRADAASSVMACLLAQAGRGVHIRRVGDLRRVA